MITLAALRYRNVFVSAGGPIERIACGELPVRGKTLALANAFLRPGLMPAQEPGLFSTAAGTGTNPLPCVARHKAISEALERWAFFANVRSERAADFGFDVDPTSTGLSAIPGFFRAGARRTSVLEAVERFCLCSWWEGRIDGDPFQTDWPGVSALALRGPFGGLTVVAWAQTDWGDYVYGHAAEESLGAACERAVVELARHERVLRSARMAGLAGHPRKPNTLFERRCVFFASADGFALFDERCHRRAWSARPAVEVICDRELPGPWSVYATVWRFALRPPSEGFLRGGERYFFL